ncbi:hypothetical protein ADL05_23070 [Nocardiopsis sp. NRRL B-16309]|nr:hypothetical protein ADL05_23070 [Nocardiopsis sp. NRRL B-16309]
MRWNWKRKPNTAPPTPAPGPVRQDSEPDPAPEPEHVQEESTALAEPVTGPIAQPTADWSWITPTRVAVAAAIVPSALSLVWVASTVAEITGGASGLVAGIFADVLIVSTVAVGWFNADVRRQASLGGWVASIAAGLLLGWHHWGTEEVAFALVPVGAKFLWHVALTARTAWERRRDQAARSRAEAERQAREATETREAAEAGADDCSLTVEQRRQIADLKRAAAFARAKADAEAEESKAKIHAEQTVDMATDQAEAERLKARYELAAQIGGRLPLAVLAQFLPDLPGVEVSEVPTRNGAHSRLEAAPRPEVAAAATVPAGFGAGLIEASASTHRKTAPAANNAGSDLREHPNGAAPAPVPSNAGSDLGERPQEVQGAALARQRLIEQTARRRADAMALWKQGWCAPEIAHQMGRDKRTIRSYLAEEGVTATDMERRIRDRVQAYIEHKGPDTETRAMARDLHLSRNDAKDARERLAADGHQVYGTEQ